MKFLQKLQSSQAFWFLFITSIVFFFLRLPSLFEPYWYGDEGVYEIIGFALRHGRLLYSGIWDNKPPMLYIIYALFNGDQVAAKFLSLLAGLFATWAIFALSKKMFSSFLPVALTTGIFALLFGLPLLEGNIANAENFMLLPGILAGFLIFSLSKKQQKKNTLLLFFFAGLLLGVSFLIKVVAVFDLFAFCAFFILIQLADFSKKTILAICKSLLPIAIGFLLPVILCVLFFVITGTFSIFLHATLLSNVGYVNYGNAFIIPQGFLILKTLLVFSVVLFFLIRRKHIQPATLFIFLWIIFTVYSSLFSGRPYTHYALLMLPAFSLLVGLFLDKKNLRVISGMSLLFVMILVVKAFTLYSHPLTYYQNFLQYLFGQKTQSQYQAFFDGGVPREYGLVQYINAHKTPKQTLFIWGNNAQMYKMTNTLPEGRFTVAYHITLSYENFAETQTILAKNPPKFVIILPGESTPPISLMQYQEKIIIDNTIIYEHI